MQHGAPGHIDLLCLSRQSLISVLICDSNLDILSTSTAFSLRFFIKSRISFCRFACASLNIIFQSLNYDRYQIGFLTQIDFTCAQLRVNLQFQTILRNSSQFHAIPCNSEQFRAILHNSVQSRVIPHNSIQFRAIQRNSGQFCTIPGNSAQIRANLHRSEQQNGETERLSQTV